MSKIKSIRLIKFEHLNLLKIKTHYKDHQSVNHK